MKITILVLKFLIIGALFIVSNNNLALIEKENVQEFGTLYYNWLEYVFDNVKQITSFVVKADWAPRDEYDSNILLTP